MKSQWDEYLVNIKTVPEKQVDVIVIGSGMGGGMVTLALCLSGAKVLLIEKGKSFLEQTKLTGIEVEQKGVDHRLMQGRWPVKMSSRVEGANSDFFAPLGCGLGGSTLIYGGAVERFSPEDFEPTSLPSGEEIVWPYTYKEIEPYYQWAEQLLNVQGTVDELEVGASYSLNTPPELNPTDKYFESLFRKCGLHPYHLHVAIDAAENTRNRDNVKGSLESCIIPALQTGNLLIAADCEVESLSADETRIRTIEVVQSEQRESLHVSDKRVVVACGAYFTPALLLRSSNQLWPDGLGNSNGLVGRYLMFHACDYLGIWSAKRHSEQGADKTLGLRDFYSVDGEKLGQLQSTGKSAEMGYILYFLRQKLEKSLIGKIPIVSQVVRQLLRIPAYVACILFKEVSIFSSIVEDFPYEENRVVLDPDKPSGIRLDYSIKDELRQRVGRFRNLVKETIKGHWVVNFSQGIDLNFGHPCGTCRAGEESTKSVVNSDGRVHGIANAYIADGSFMPTSGGTNPSLTIAAHSLRVGDLLAKEISRLP